MRASLCSAVLSALLPLCVTIPAPAQPATPSATPPAPAATAAPAPKPFLTRVTGSGPPMIFIPGLLCGGAVWNDTVRHYEDRYQCHTLSLAGFAGVPPVEGPFVPTMRDAIVRYIRDNKLEKPIIVGHSLGGHLALAVAIEAPDEVGPIVVVDGAPALGALMFPGVPAETIASRSTFMTAAMSNMPPAQFAAQNRLTLGTMVQDPAKADWLASHAAKSDIKTTARVMHEIMTADLRPAAARITAPVLLIGAAEHAKDPASQAAARRAYEQQVTMIPRHQVVMTYEARHFIMFDKPDFLFTTLDQFLAGSP